VILIDHPLVQHKLTLLRTKQTSTSCFRQLLSEVASLMVYELCRDLPLRDVLIETPLEPMSSRVLDGKKLVFASILRAGNGFLDGMLSMVPGARVRAWETLATEPSEPNEEGLDDLCGSGPDCSGLQCKISCCPGAAGIDKSRLSRLHIDTAFAVDIDLTCTLDFARAATAHSTAVVDFDAVRFGQLEQRNMFVCLHRHA
jgi:hypothetical protein